ncbi:MAG: hypothetical protein RMJ56_14110 [Gemmataceae bacterium]|nr:hypothetical protein [Gemmata sp.]MDW8198727.1 hypothetical protein [Gemmataceae bacterium]
MKRLFGAETLFFLVTWLALLIAFRERGFYDPGSLWHIKVGEIILERGMPQTDPFSYTLADHPWVPQQWGAEVLMAWAHRAGGLDALLLSFATAVAFLYTLIFRRCVQNGMGPLLAGLIVGGGLCVGAFHYFIRPHMFTIAFLAWTMMSLIDYERGRATLWRLVGLIPLYVVWVNLHGGVLGGTLTLGLAVAGWIFLFALRGLSTATTSSGFLRRCLDTPVDSWRTALILVAIVAACGLTPFVNPHGLAMIQTWQRIVGSKVLPQVVHEHMPLDPESPLGLMVLAWGGFYLLLLAGTLPQWPRISWLLPLVWLAFSFQGIRQAPLFAICAAVASADLWPHTRWHRLLLHYGDGSTAWDTSNAAEAPRHIRPLGPALLVPALVVALAGQLNAHRVDVPVIGCGWARLDPAFIPSDLTPEVVAYAQRVPPGTPIFNDANLGGYLIYHAPNLKIFMDDRCELYGDENIRFYAETMGRTPEELGRVLEQWAARYGFERALILTNPPGRDPPPIERYLSTSPRWVEVARGQRAALYERVR